MGVKLNRNGVADMFGTSLPTIDRWIREGMPFDQRGSRGVEWVFDSADVTRWYGDRRAKDAAGDNVSDLDEIERRTKLAKMHQAELELAKEQGAVAPVAEFEKVQAARYAMIRANVLNVPQRAVLQLLGETDETIFKQKLRAELSLALDTAANAQLDLGEDDDEADE